MCADCPGSRPDRAAPRRRRRPTFEQILEELKRIKRRLAGAGQGPSTDGSYGYLASLHGSTATGAVQPAEWSLSQGHTDMAGAGGQGTGGPGTASTPSGAPGSLEHSSGMKSTYVEGSTFLQSIAAVQQAQQALPGSEDGEEEEEEEEEEQGFEESEVLVQGGSMQLNSEPQHLV
jgi:hypothetical protein